MSATDTAQPGAGYVGQAMRRKEDPRMITGGSRYTDNMVLPGQLYAAIVRSPEAHARLFASDLPRVAKLVESSGIKQSEAK